MIASLLHGGDLHDASTVLTGVLALSTIPVSFAPCIDKAAEGAVHAQLASMSTRTSDAMETRGGKHADGNGDASRNGGAKGNGSAEATALSTLQSAIGRVSKMGSTARALRETAEQAAEGRQKAAFVFESHVAYTLREMLQTAEVIATDCH